MVSPIRGSGSADLPKGELARQALSEPLLAKASCRDIPTIPLGKGFFSPTDEALELTAEEAKAFAQNILDFL